ncbi:MAG TPA: hypothetical protein VMT20_04285, partial [Terriglobia bacterium]|nr:hypothetical protein [Terriglobia bacterium]
MAVSDDLRERVVEAVVVGGLSRNQAASHFKGIPAGWAAGADDRSTSALFARRHFAVDLDQFNEAFDAEVGEGHDALV